jgi:hypothetical protein
LTADALGDVNLPSDDHAWDQGVRLQYLPGDASHDANGFQIKPFRPQKKVGDPQSLPGQGIGRFALAAETVRILGQVHNHITAATFGDRLHSEEALLLDSALRALENVVESEGAQHNLSVMNQATMCSMYESFFLSWNIANMYSSISMLHEAHASRNTEMSAYFNDNHRVHEANDILAEARKHMIDLPRVKPVHACIKETSPFISLPLYHYARANLHLYQKDGSQETWHRWIANKQTLRDFDARWKASGKLLNMYLRMVGNLHEIRSVFKDLRGTGDVSCLVSPSLRQSDMLHRSYKLILIYEISFQDRILDYCNAEGVLVTLSLSLLLFTSPGFYNFIPSPRELSSYHTPNDKD